MIRAQIRCPLHGRSNSGVVVVDVHDILVAQGNTQPSKNISFNPSALAAPSDAALASIGFKRLLLSVSAARTNKAHAVVSIGPLVTPSDKPDPAETVRPLHPKLSFAKSSVASYAKSVLSLSLPSVFVDLTKESLDSLQYWIDDVSQLGQLASNGTDTDSDTEKAASRNPSLIGSRFFAQSRSGSGDTSLLSPDIPPAASETVMKLQITEGTSIFFCHEMALLTLFEACIRIKLPRLSEELVVVRPFDILGSDIDVLVELKPGGKVCPSS